MSDILVIDDDLDIRVFLTHALQHAGHVVITAADGEEALGLASNFPVDLAFIDMRMPNCDGFEVVKALNKSNPAIKKVVMSGEESLLPQMEALGADRVLPKPLSVETILSTVSSLLEP